MGRRPNEVLGKIALYYRAESYLSGYYAVDLTSLWKTVYRHHGDTSSKWLMSAWSQENIEQHEPFQRRDESECPDAGSLAVTLGLTKGTIGF